MAKKKMSDDHKAALAKGRAQGNVVRAYLEALRAHQPKRGRKRTPDSIAKQLESIEQELQVANPAKELELLQRRRDLQRELETMGDGSELEELQRDFIGVAAEYGERKGIEYATWREFGVPAAVLKQAGVSRSAA
ncbi:MAG: hypothetical protein AAGA17_03560 [Actinomycetota bacterium]